MKFPLLWGSVVIETLAREEVAGKPEKYIQLAEEKEEEMQRDFYKLRQELRLLCTMKNQKEIADERRTSGIPEQRRPETYPEEAEATRPSSFQSAPLKVAHALNEAPKKAATEEPRPR